MTTEEHVHQVQDTREHTARGSGNGASPTMGVAVPRVSVGLPVFNGDNYLVEAIESHLAQTFADFELVICDNGSTDGTEAICRRFADRDPRIRYLRFDANIGAASNFNRAFQLARGEYFRWASHDDRIRPEYLEACVAILDSFPDTVLCHSNVRLINPEGKPVDTQRQSAERINSVDVRVRFRENADPSHQCLDVFGLIRRSALEQTSLIEGYPGSDRILLAELALHGRFYRLWDPLFESRIHPERSICQDPRSFAEWFAPGAGDTAAYSQWLALQGYLRGVSRAPLPIDRRIACSGVVAEWMVKNSRRLTIQALRVAVASVSARASHRRRSDTGA